MEEGIISFVSGVVLAMLAAALVWRTARDARDAYRSLKKVLSEDAEVGDPEGDPSARGEARDASASASDASSRRCGDASQPGTARRLDRRAKLLHGVALALALILLVAGAVASNGLFFRWKASRDVRSPEALAQCCFVVGFLGQALCAVAARRGGEPRLREALFWLVVEALACAALVVMWQAAG